MQKQKTIAKWLAVILLVTVAVACYIVLDALLPSEENEQQPNIAGADSIGNDDANNQNNQDNTPTVEPTPVYSSLPRENERVKDMNIAHVGGENNDNLLDAAYLYSKTLVIFKSESTQYDVKENGIYIASFTESTLIKTVCIAPSTHTYLGCVQTSGGILIATSNSIKTILSLYDENLSLKCQSSTQTFKHIYFCQDLKSTEIFAYDSNTLKHAFIDNELNATFSNFLFQIEEPEVVEIIKYGEKTLIFCNDKENAFVLTYSQKEGFTRCKQYDKHLIVQVLPISQSGQQAFILLNKTSDGYMVFSLSDTLMENASYCLDNVNNAHIYKGAANIEIVADNNLLCLCSHLEFISNSQLKIDENSYNINEDIFDNISSISTPVGASDYILFNTNGRYVLFKKDGQLLSVVTHFSAFSPPIVFTGINNTNQPYLQLVFDSDNSNDFSYMCFGKSDVFLISLLTT